MNSSAKSLIGIRINGNKVSAVYSLCKAYSSRSRGWSKCNGGAFYARVCRVDESTVTATNAKEMPTNGRRRYDRGTPGHDTGKRLRRIFRGRKAGSSASGKILRRLRALSTVLIHCLGAFEPIFSNVAMSASLRCANGPSFFPKRRKMRSASAWLGDVAPLRISEACPFETPNSAWRSLTRNVLSMPTGSDIPNQRSIAKFG